MTGIPVLMAEGDCIARAWENALVLLYESGCDIKTQYDKPDDPPSKDATMIVTCPRSAGRADDPPRLSRRVRGAAGIRDGGLRGDQGPLRPRPERPATTRAGNTPITSGCSGTRCPTLAPIDQIEHICRQLADTPYTRRAQAITWKVWEDNACYDPACLQSIWCRIIEEDEPAAC